MGEKKLKRIIALFLALIMICGNLPGGTGFQVNADSAENLILHYEFNEETGASGTEIVDSSGYGYHGEIIGEGADISDGTLTLPGGKDDSDAAYVSIPGEAFVGQEDITISVWLKNETGSVYTASMFVGSTELSEEHGTPRKYWMLNAASNGDGFFKSSITNIELPDSDYPHLAEAGITPTTPGGGGQPYVMGPKTSSDWGMYTTVLTKDSITGYYNGEKIGPVEIETTFADFGDDLVAFIGKSLYPDQRYKGGVRDLKVYPEALSEEDIQSQYNAELDKTDLELGDLSEVTDNLALPSEGANGSVIIWESSDEDIISADGAVNRPAYSQGNAIVTLTANISHGEYTTSKTFEATVLRNSAESKDEALYLHYQFNEGAAAEGTQIIDASGNDNNGVIKGTGAAISDGTLTLPGGAKDSTAAYVELPTGMFDGQNTLTISLWLKNATGKNNYAAMYFGTAESLPVQYWLLNPCNPNGNMKTVITNGTPSATAPYLTEYGISPSDASLGITGPQTGTGWAYYTTVITSNSITGYYNGVKVGSVNISRSVSEFGNDLVSYIGRSSYEDMFYKGDVKDVRVYTKALNQEEVLSDYLETLVEDDAVINAILEADKEALSVHPAELRDDIDLPEKGNIYRSAISWSSSNESVLSSGGIVNRPDGNDVSVTLTATLRYADKSVSKTFDVIVKAKNDQADLEFYADQLAVDTYYVTKDLNLPQTMGSTGTVKWTSDSELITSTGKVARPADGNKEVTLTAEISVGSLTPATKTFKVLVMKEADGYLLSYAGPEDTVSLANSLHLAYSEDGVNYSELNSGSGVAFARNLGSAGNGLVSPYLLRKGDGGYAFVATNNDSKNYLYAFESDDLINYVNETEIDLGTTLKVLNPVCEYNGEKYVITWSDGINTYKNTADKIIDKESGKVTTEGPVQITTVPARELEIKAPEGARAGNILELDKDAYDTVVNKLAPVVNVGLGEIEDRVEVDILGEDNLELPETIEAYYSDGSASDVPIDWDTAGINYAKPGIYEISGKVGYTQYANPFVESKADPWIFLGADGYYYFTASYPMIASNDTDGYSRVTLRRSETIEGLQDAEEVSIWQNNSTDGIYRYIWAPEIHQIEGRWYVFFTGSTNRNDVFGIRPHILVCDEGAEPMEPESWTAKKMQKRSGDTMSFNAFSLDMTAFEAGGQWYVVWAEKPTAYNSDSVLFIATIDPDDPSQLTSDPTLLTRPEYAWERIRYNVDEGPAVLKKDGKVFLCFSAAGTGPEYCIGLMTAEEGADLLDINEWTKTPYPVLTTNDVNGEYGPGHNSFTVDAYGNDVFVYHARTEECNNGVCDYAGNDPLYDPCRHARIKTVHWAEDGTPVLKMTAEQAVAPELENITIEVQVKDQNEGDFDEAVVEAALSLDIPNSNSIKGNIHMPETLKVDGKTVYVKWISENTDIITDEVKEVNGYDVPAGVVTRQEEDESLIVRAYLSLDGSETDTDKMYERLFRLTVKAAVETDDYEAYIYTYFRSDLYGDGESQAIHLAASEDALFWDEMNQNEPILESTMGTKGLRDSYVIRAPEGDRFYLIATDLDANGGQWGDYAYRGSLSIMIWESDDLINWSEQRMVKIAPDNAGCMWAPETIYDPTTGEYIVYWASSIDEKLRMFYAKTRDFYTFTEPEIYKDIDTSTVNGSQVTNTYIDTTMIEHNGTYYRFTKLERDLTVHMETSDSALGNFSMVKDVVAGEYGVEGPAIFKLNGEEDKWMLLLDGYAGPNAGVGFFPLIADSEEDLAAANFRRLDTTEFRMPLGAKHGCVLPVTKAEYDAVIEKWGQDVVSPVEPDDSEYIQPDLEYLFDEDYDANTGAVLNTGKSGEANNGILHNGAVYKEDNEKDSQVLYLSGGEKDTNSPYLEFPQGYFDGKDNVTISMDVKSEMTSDYFFTFAVGTDNQKYLFLRTRPTQIRAAITAKSNSGEQEVLHTPSSIRNKWVNITVTLERNEDGKHSTMKLYVDGELVDSNEDLVSNLSNMGKDLIGYLGKAFYSDPYFKGFYENVRVYNRTLNEDQVADLYEGGGSGELPGDPDIIAKYDFTDGVNDVSGNNNHGTIVGSNVTVRDGVLTLPGATANQNTNYVQLPGDMFVNQDTLTIDLWLNSNTNAGNYAAMFFGTKQSLPVSYWLLNPANPSGYMKSVFTDSVSTTAPYNTERGISPTDSTRGILGPLTTGYKGWWVNYTTVITEDSITGYMNGLKIGTVPLSRTVSSFGSDLAAYLGKSSYADPIYAGSYKDVTVYSKALTEAEVYDSFITKLEDSNAVKYALENLAVIGEEGGRITVDQLGLATSNDHFGVNISWKSSDVSLVLDNGAVVGNPEEKTYITLTATLTKGNAVLTKEFTVYLLPEGVTEFTLDVDTEKQGIDISETLVGLFYEDINNSADGGLNPQMVKNNSFENYRYDSGKRVNDYKNMWVADPASAFEVASADGINDRNENYAVLTGDVVLTNNGYTPINSLTTPSMAVKENVGIDFSVFTKAEAGYQGVIKVKIVDADGNDLTEEITVQPAATGSWEKVTGTLTGKETKLGAMVFMVEGSQGAVLNVDMISLSPQDTYGYGNKNYGYGAGLREDLVEMLAGIDPSFIRFPGGCIIEGAYEWDTYYDWKNTIGSMEERKQIPNLWGNDATYGYMQSYGLGYHEILQLCEDLGADAYPILNAGIICQIRSGNIAPAQGEHLEEFVKDATDLMDYCWGDPDTNEMAAQRAENGHEEPFDLKYIGIGNENWDDVYFKNFDYIYDKVMEYRDTNYPGYELTIIAAVGVAADDDANIKAWNWLNQTHQGDDILVDEHYYVDAAFSQTFDDRYDYFLREDQGGLPVFLGEYATRLGVPNGLESALSDAAYMIGAERNSDIVKNVSYAPLFNKMGSTNWETDLIWFDDYESIGSINYYVQQMFSLYTGTKALNNPVMKLGERYDRNTGSPLLETYATEGYIESIKVIRADGKVLLDETFDDSSKTKDLWQSFPGSTGTFEIKDGRLYLSKGTAMNGVWIPSVLDDEEWYDFEMKVTAVKVSGNEGFMIGAAKGGAEFYHYNMGGWSNSRNVIQRNRNGATGDIVGNDREFITSSYYATPAYQRVPSNEELTIYFNYGVNGKLEAGYTSDSVTVYEKQYSMNLRPYQNEIYSVTSMDEDFVYVKFVNTDSYAKQIAINLEDVDVYGETAYAMVIAGDSLSDVNTMDDEAITMVQNLVPIENDGVLYTIPKYSVNTVIIPLSDETPVIPGPYEFAIEPAEAEINVGESIELSITGNYAGELTWTSSNEQIAAVDNYGRVNGIKEGTVTITATDEEGNSAEAVITVKASATPDPVDFTKLREAIKEAEAIDTALYTDKSVADLNIALTAAYSALETEGIDQNTVNRYTAELIAAIEGLVKIVPDPIDFSRLEEAIKDAKAVERDKYTADSLADLDVALAAAEKALTQEGITQAEVDRITKELSDAIEALEEVTEPPKPIDPADKTALGDAVEQAEKIDMSKYTSETAASLQTALAAAKAGLEIEDISQETVDKLTADLLAAIEALEEITDKPVKTDKKALKKAIKEAEKINLSKYTDDSGAILKTALAAAKAALDDDNVSQDTIDKLTKDLESAIAGLQIKSADDGKDNKDGKDGKVKTGDQAPIIIFIVIAVAALLAVVILVVRKKRK